MNEIIPNGSNIFTQSFTQRWAQELVQDFDGRSSPDSYYSFDGFKIGGFADKFGSDRRWVCPSDVGDIFKLILG